MEQSLKEAERDAKEKQRHDVLMRIAHGATIPIETLNEIQV